MVVPTCSVVFGLVFLSFVASARRRARHDGQRAVTPERHATEGLLEKNLPVLRHSGVVDTHHSGGVPGDDQQRTLVLGSADPVGRGGGGA